MEAIHGVDVSWLHRPTEGQGPTSTAPAPPSAIPSQQKPAISFAQTTVASSQAQTETRPSTVQSPAQQTPSKVKRPGILSKGSSEKVPSKSSFLSSISSKFSSSSSQSNATAAQAATAKGGSSASGKLAGIASSVSGTSSVPKDDSNDNAIEDGEAFVPQQSKSGSSFFSSALRRLSSNAPARGPSVSSMTSVASPRQTLNIDRERERCIIEELEPAKLRRVAFRVDVELMGGSKWSGEGEPEKKKRKEKYKEKGEGEALKHPELLSKELQASEKEEASTKHAYFEAEKPVLKQKERAEGEALKHPGSIKEDKKFQGRKRADSDASQKSTVMTGLNESLDDLDLYSGGIMSSKSRQKPGVVQEPKSHAPQPRKNMVDDWDDLDPYSGGGVAKSKEKAAKKLLSERSQRSLADRAEAHLHMDDLDPFGGGPKKIKRPTKLPASVGDEEVPDSLDFFYGAGLQRETSRTSQISPPPSGRSPPLDAGRISFDGRDEPSQTSPPLPNTITDERAGPDRRLSASSNISATEDLPNLGATSLPTVSTPPEEFPSFTSSIPSSAPPKSEDRPTTDPLRVYRRCCQLREAPVLKRISEQLASAQNPGNETPGIIATLNLNKSRMQLADMICLADWLAIVPVKKLTLEDANLTDEGLRVILAGLLAAKVPETKRKRLKSSPNQTRESERSNTGMIERLSLKNNRKITAEGWKHLCVFLNMSKSIKAVDVSMIPFPLFVPQAGTSQPPKRRDSSDATSLDMADLLRKSLVGRGKNNNLRELLIAECGLSAYQVGKICEGAATIRVERLGLASNHLDRQGLQHIARYLSSGIFTGLDVGGNDLHNNMDILTKALTKDTKNPIWLLSFANCNLSSKDLEQLLQALITLPDVRLLDLSHNRQLFATSETLAILRRYLPNLPLLKRLDLGDTSMTPALAIGIAEVIPECRNLNHINVLDNSQLKSVLVEPTEVAAQEEAAAVYASMMTAVRLSKTMLCVDIDVPSPKASEIVKALARQVVAYCLRNIERFTEADAVKVADAAAALPDVDPEEGDGRAHIMQHFMDHPGSTDLQPGGGHGAHEDYLVGGTGVVKALSYCLSASQLRRMSTQPGTPRDLIESDAGKATAKEMSRTLLESAHKFRTSLQPVMAREAQVASGTNFDIIRRLQFLDQTLQGMIERFEHEYPETRQPGPTRSPDSRDENFEVEAVEPDSRSRASSGASGTSRGFLDNGSSTTSASTVAAIIQSSTKDLAAMPRPNLAFSASSHHGSETSLASRALAEEEARMHRIGQRLRRQVLPPTGTEDYLHGTHMGDREPEHLAALRAQLELLGGEELRVRIMEKGLERTIKELGDDAEKLRLLELTEPEKFRRFREAQERAEMKGGFGSYLKR